MRAVIRVLVATAAVLTASCTPRSPLARPPLANTPAVVRTAGDSATPGATHATPLPAPAPRTLVTSGDTTCAIAGPERAVACWGSDSVGELGTAKQRVLAECPDPIGTKHGSDDDALEHADAGDRSLARPSCSTRPVLIPNLRGALDLVTDRTGGAFCAALDGGHVHCWGRIHAELRPAGEIAALRGAIRIALLDRGILGRTAERTVAAPAELAMPAESDLAAWRAFAPTRDGGCVLLDDGRLRCTGRTAAGNLSTQQPECANRDLLRAACTTALARATGVAGAAQAVCAVADGRLWCWGATKFGIPGVGSTPEPVPGLDNIVAVSVGDLHVCALDALGGVWCFGDNHGAQLGACAASACANATRVSGLPPIAELAAGSRHSCALDTDGIVWCWGDNTKGQLGDGTTERRSSPVRILDTKLGHQLVTVARPRNGLPALGAVGTSQPLTTTTSTRWRSWPEASALKSRLGKRIRMTLVSSSSAWMRNCGWSSNWSVSE